MLFKDPLCYLCQASLVGTDDAAARQKRSGLEQAKQAILEALSLFGLLSLPFFLSGSPAKADNGLSTKLRTLHSEALFACLPKAKKVSAVTNRLYGSLALVGFGFSESKRMENKKKRNKKKNVAISGPFDQGSRALGSLVFAYITSGYSSCRRSKRPKPKECTAKRRDKAQTRE